jgi:D-alanyl-D-alanine carboxypeptidase
MILRTIAITLLLAATGCTHAALPETRAGHATADHRALQERVQLAADQIVASQRLPSASVAVITGDGVELTAASGYADKETGRRMRPTTPLLGASTGKTVVAALALALQADGKLDLDDPISKWLGERPWFSRLPNASTITIRHLLNHTSGLPDHVYLEEFTSAFAKRVSADPDLSFSPDELISFVLDKKALPAAGTKFDYSDTNYILAGLILEKAGGATYYSQVQQRFLGPLGLDQTRPSVRRDIPGLAAGYMDEKNPFGLPGKSLRDGKLVFNPALEWTGGGFATTARDLARWGRALFEGRAMERPYLQEMLTPGPAAIEGAPDRRYGLGVGMRTAGSYGPTWGHGGGMPYYSSILGYYPERRLTVAIVVNADDFDRDAAQKLVIEAVTASSGL